MPSPHTEAEFPPLATTRESPRTATKAQHSQKEKKKEKKNTTVSLISRKFNWAVKYA